MFIYLLTLITAQKLKLHKIFMNLANRKAVLKEYILLQAK